MELVELGGGGLNWVEVGARISNTQNLNISLNISSWKILLQIGNYETGR